MADINNVTLTGRITRDCEFKEVGNATLVTGSIASNRSVKKGDKWENEASFFEFKVWCRSEGQVKFYRSILSKGSAITMTGSLVQERWEKDGKKNSRVVIMATDVVGGGTRGSSESSSSGGVPSGGNSDFPEDIPF